MDIKNDAKAFMIKGNNQSIYFNYGIGLFYYCDKDYEEAIKMYDQAIKLDLKYVDAYNNKGSNH